MEWKHETVCTLSIWSHHKTIKLVQSLILYLDGNEKLYPIVCLPCIVVNFYLDFMGCGYGFPFDNSFMSHPCYIPKIPVSIFAIKRLHTTGCEII